MKQSCSRCDQRPTVQDTVFCLPCLEYLQQVCTTDPLEPPPPYEWRVGDRVVSNLENAGIVGAIFGNKLTVDWEGASTEYEVTEAASFLHKLAPPIGDVGGPSAPSAAAMWAAARQSDEVAFCDLLEQYRADCHRMWADESLEPLQELIKHMLDSAERLGAMEWQRGKWFCPFCQTEAEGVLYGSSRIIISHCPNSKCPMGGVLRVPVYDKEEEQSDE